MKQTHTINLLLIYAAILTSTLDTTLALTTTLVSLVLGIIWFAYFAPINCDLETGELVVITWFGRCTVYQVLEVAPTKIRLSPGVLLENPSMFNVADLLKYTGGGEWVARRVVQYITANNGFVIKLEG